MKYVIRCKCNTIRMVIDEQCKSECIAKELGQAAENGYSVECVAKVSDDEWHKDCTCPKELQLSLFEV
jgi:hypothetical protein